MKICFLLLLFLGYSFSALGAPKDTYWYKVESTQSKQEAKKNKSYPYDSLDDSVKKQHFRPSLFWTKEQKLFFYSGFHADKSVFEDGQTNRFLFGTGLRVLNRAWHRFSISTYLLQNNSLFLNGSWEYMPSREANRVYYGLGAAQVLLANKEFRNFIENENFFVTAHAGYELLLQSGKAWNVEAKAYLSLSSYAIQVSVGYIIPI